MRKEGNEIVMLEGEKWDHNEMRVNTKRFVILRNIRNNIRRQLPQLNAPYPDNPNRIALVGGGWSLDHTLDELRALYFDGVKIAAVNGSARWLMERNLRPSMHIVLDARPENIEFVREPIPHCKYFFASQIDPSLIDICEGRDVTLFHGVGEGSDLEIRRLDDFYEKRWVRVPTAGTVGVTSVMLLRILGFVHQHLFGIDSCYEPGTRAHHAYPQALNEAEDTAIFRIVGKEFEAATWQASQIQSFLAMMQLNGELLQHLTFHGEGMLAHVVRNGGGLPLPEVKEA